MNPSQIHLALTHIPVVLSVAALVVLALSLFRKNDILTQTSFYIFLIAGLFAIPVYLSGEGTEEVVENLPGVSKELIERHEDVAKISLVIIISGACLSLAGLLFYKNLPFARFIKPLVFLIAFVAAGFMAQTAHLGGQIRHPEIRSGFVPQTENTGSGDSQNQGANNDSEDKD